jgi:predicted PurR-regulated permease PerM
MKNKADLVGLIAILKTLAVYFGIILAIVVPLLWPVLLGYVGWLLVQREQRKVAERNAALAKREIVPLPTQMGAL